MGEYETAREPGHGGRGGRSRELDEGQPEARRRRSSHARSAGKPRGGRAAEGDSEDDGGDDAGEGVDRRAEEQRREPRPTDLGGHGGKPGERCDSPKGEHRPATEPGDPNRATRPGSRRPSETGEDEDPRGQVRRDPTHRGSGETQFGNEQTSGRDAADERAGGVGGIEPTGRASFAAVPDPPGERGQRRQGRAHQGGGGQEKHRRDDGGEDGGTRSHVRKPQQREAPSQIQRQPRGKSGSAEFQQEEPPGQTGNSEPPPRSSGEQRAEPQPAEKHGEDQRHRGVRRPENHGEAPHPDDLVGQRREPGEQERDREERHGRRVRHGSRAPGCRARRDGTPRARGLSPPAQRAEPGERSRGGLPPERPARRGSAVPLHPRFSAPRPPGRRPSDRSRRSAVAPGVARNHAQNSRITAGYTASSRSSRHRCRARLWSSAR